MGREEEGNFYSLLTFFQRLLHVGGKEWPIVWCGHHIVALVLVRGGRLDIGSDTRYNGSVGWDVMLHVQGDVNIKFQNLVLFCITVVRTQTHFSPSLKETNKG